MTTMQSLANSVSRGYWTQRYRFQKSPDVFTKCESFASLLRNVPDVAKALYRVPVSTPLHGRVRSTDGRELVCFDSNSYLGLHRHPRVVEATAAALGRYGYGTPSAQLLGGTSEPLLELEDTLARYHRREAAMVFPTGYTANIGVMAALTGRDDAVLRDRFCHASLRDGSEASGSETSIVYPHRNMAALAATLGRLEPSSRQGRLIVTDGVFSMHGTVAPLLDLRRIATQHGARLLLDDAHATGVFGPHGRGLEDYFGMEGAADVLVGTFSKTPGTMGGYVCGSQSLIQYLRFHANAGLFTASFPAFLCVGVIEAYRLMEEDPSPRERLWRNARVLHAELMAAGLPVAPLESPILPVFVGRTELLWGVGQALLDSGIKCSSVDFPAVPRDQGLVRLSVNATHTDEDLERTVQAFRLVGERFDLLGQPLPPDLVAGDG